jgi:hypothetical protein
VSFPSWRTLRPQDPPRLKPRLEEGETSPRQLSFPVVARLRERPRSRAAREAAQPAGAQAAVQAAEVAAEVAAARESALGAVAQATADVVQPTADVEQATAEVGGEAEGVVAEVVLHRTSSAPVLTWAPESKRSQRPGSRRARPRTQATTRASSHPERPPVRLLSPQSACPTNARDGASWNTAVVRSTSTRRPLRSLLTHQTAAKPWDGRTMSHLAPAERIAARGSETSAQPRTAPEFDERHASSACIANAQ